MPKRTRRRRGPVVGVEVGVWQLNRFHMLSARMGVAGGGGGGGEGAGGAGAVGGEGGTNGRRGPVVGVEVGVR